MWRSIIPPCSPASSARYDEKLEGGPRVWHRPMILLCAASFPKMKAAADCLDSGKYEPSDTIAQLPCRMLEIMCGRSLVLLRSRSGCCWFVGMELMKAGIVVGVGGVM